MFLNANWSHNTNIYFNFRVRLTTHSGVLGKLIYVVSQAVKKLVAFYGTQKFHYGVYNSLPQFPIISQVNSVHTLPLHCDEVHFNIILQSSRLQVSPPKPCKQFVILN